MKKLLVVTTLSIAVAAVIKRVTELEKRKSFNGQLWINPELKRNQQQRIWIENNLSLCN